jgi:hypothetical protein
MGSSGPASRSTPVPDGTGTTPPSGSAYCCMCGSDGHYHCASACSGGSTIGGTGGGSDGSAFGGPADAGSTGNPPMTCAQGGTCTPGSRCGGGDVTGACISCMCGQDGTLACTPCDAAKDGGATLPPDDGGFHAPPMTCAQGGTCTPGSRCGGADPAGACQQCICGQDGTLACSSCAKDDGGAPPLQGDGGATQPMSCVQGGACPQPGLRCGGSDPAVGCMDCMCGADGTLSCTPCGAAKDGGAPQGGDGGATQPMSCVQGGACPQQGLRCGGSDPTLGCINCLCGVDGTLSCTACGAPKDGGAAPPPSDGGMTQQPIPPAQCQQGLDCASPGQGCDSGSINGTCSKCTCDPTHTLSCTTYSC